ncbi:putative thymidylate synthase [Dinoroseobacter phage DFL12phi1]|uniref:Thymidylate synthase n=1 Tax=Dinoroseobacter phage DFL12phi1 TaxID=1477404 RepID=A0A023NGL2_9CAUD|nr:putative thymidylate synthase [Dinoroseobacter phage DFL12phi1]AHX01016.1 putative thymidylate synthase [Dinoroseobacter phage DFL12phi1]
METSNLVYTHPGQPQMQVEVILASAANACPHIYTIRMRYPRPIHGEIMTHRVFGRNARSSRAVPVKTMLNEVRTIPYVPWHWGKNQKGMQASEECNELIELDVPQVDEITQELDYETVRMTNEEAWLHARTEAADIAEAFMEAGYHKQNPNRLLEPFSWMDTLITATQWDNFLWLRQHHAAEPHLIDLANLVAKAISEADVQNLTLEQWHMPYITEKDIKHVKGLYGGQGTDFVNQILLNISAARCARISYKPFNGDGSITAELDRAKLLMNDERVHASPFEHQAKPDERIKCPTSGNLEGWHSEHLHGNLTGWIQHRKLIPNEVYHG